MRRLPAERGASAGLPVIEPPAKRETSLSSTSRLHTTCRVQSNLECALLLLLSSASALSRIGLGFLPLVPPLLPPPPRAVRILSSSVKPLWRDDLAVLGRLP